MLIDIGTEAGVKQQDALGMPYQNAAHLEYPVLAQAAAAIGHARG